MQHLASLFPCALSIVPSTFLMFSSKMNWPKLEQKNQINKTFCPKKCVGRTKHRYNLLNLVLNFWVYGFLSAVKTILYECFKCTKNKWMKYNKRKTRTDIVVQLVIVISFKRQWLLRYSTSMNTEMIWLTTGKKLTASDHCQLQLAIATMSTFDHFDYRTWHLFILNSEFCTNCSRMKLQSFCFRTT